MSDKGGARFSSNHVLLGPKETKNQPFLFVIYLLPRKLIGLG